MLNIFFKYRTLYELYFSFLSISILLSLIFKAGETVEDSDISEFMSEDEKDVETLEEEQEEMPVKTTIQFAKIDMVSF